MAAKILIINEICNYFMLTLLKDRVIKGCFMTKDRVIKGCFMTKDRVMKRCFMTKDRVKRVFVTDFQSKQTARDRGERHSFMYKFLIMALMLSQDDNI